MSFETMSLELISINEGSKTISEKIINNLLNDNEADLQPTFVKNQAHFNEIQNASPKERLNLLFFIVNDEKELHELEKYNSLIIEKNHIAIACVKTHKTHISHTEELKQHLPNLSKFSIFLSSSDDFLDNVCQLIATFNQIQTCKNMHMVIGAEDIIDTFKTKGFIDFKKIVAPKNKIIEQLNQLENNSSISIKSILCLIEADNNFTLSDKMDIVEQIQEYANKNVEHLIYGLQINDNKHITINLIVNWI